MNNSVTFSKTIRFIPVLSTEDVYHIPKDDVIGLKKGRVILVRSTYKHEVYGDHFSLIVGGKIQKDRGMRPNLVTLPPLPQSHPNVDLLDQYPPTDGATVLLLSESAAKDVLDSYEIHLSEGDLISI